MRIYATIKADKLQDGRNVIVSKSQGSNRMVEIEVTVMDDSTGVPNLVGRLTLSNNVMRFRSLVSEQDMLVQLPIRYQAKGEKQKGEIDDTQKGDCECGACEHHL